MSAWNNVEGAERMDFAAMETPAERLAERYRDHGMSLGLAERMIADLGADFVDGNEVGKVQRLNEAWRKMAMEIYSRKTHARLVTGAFLLALGWLPTGIRSQRDMARHFRVSVEYVSGLVEYWQQDLGLPRTAQQKSERAVFAARLYHKKNRRKHVRK